MQRLRILIGKDNLLAAARLAAQLESLGHQVLGVVREGHAVVAAARELRPDLILLDLHLAPLGWIEAVRAILSRHAIPVILLTGYSSADVVRRAQEAGVLTCLVTPSEETELRSTIEVALTRFGEFRVLWDEVGDLQQALQARIVVERAKKVLMRRLTLADPEAFRYLHRHGRSEGMALQELAENILATEDVLFGEPGVVRCLQAILLTLRQDKVFQPPVSLDLPSLPFVRELKAG